MRNNALYLWMQLFIVHILETFYLNHYQYLELTDATKTRCNIDLFHETTSDLKELESNLKTSINKRSTQEIGYHLKHWSCHFS